VIALWEICMKTLAFRLSIPSEKLHDRMFPLSTFCREFFLRIDSEQIQEARILQSILARTRKCKRDVYPPRLLVIFRSLPISNK